MDKNMTEKRFCLNCGKELTGYQTKYCCHQCQKNHQRNDYIQRWKQGLEDGLSGEYGLSRYIKNYLLEKNNNQCEICGWHEENPYTHKIPLEIHHKDGDYKNNQENNLQVLCPNCHSLTPTFKAANKNGRSGRQKYYEKKKNYCIKCGKEISLNASMCPECRAFEQRTVERPSREDLKEMIRTIPFTHIAEAYGVSDKAIVKWCVAENLPSRKTDIKKYSDEEWAKI